MHEDPGQTRADIRRGTPTLELHWPSLGQSKTAANLKKNTFVTAAPRDISDLRALRWIRKIITKIDRTASDI
jgi:hypothetical protein